MSASVFVSSTYASLELEREYLAMVLRRMGFTPIQMPEQSLAGSRSKAYMDEIEKAQIVVVMIDGFSEPVSEEIGIAYELGIPVVALARLRKDGGKTGLTDRARTFQSEHPEVFLREFSSRAELEGRATASLSEIVKKRLTAAASFERLSDSIYSESQTRVRSCEGRFALVQRSSTLVLGPMPGRPAERRFLESLQQWVDKQVVAGTAHFVHMVEIERTREAVASTKLPALDKSLAWLRSAMDRSAGRLRLIPVHAQVTAMVLADASFAVSVNLGSPHYMWMDEHGRAANHLWDALLEMEPDIDPVEFLDDIRNHVPHGAPGTA